MNYSFDEVGNPMINAHRVSTHHILHMHFLLQLAKEQISTAGVAITYVEGTPLVQWREARRSDCVK